MHCCPICSVIQLDNHELLSYL